MQITLRTGGRLRHFLPQGSSGSKATLDLTGQASVADVMARLGLPLEDSYLVTLNGELVPPAARAGAMLSEGDDLGLFPPLKSG